MLQLKFGWDFNHDLIGTYIAGEVMKSGTVVARGADDVLSPDTSGFLLLQDVDATGPTFQQIVLGVINYKVAVNSPVTVALWRAGGIIETDNVDKGAAESIKVGDLFKVVAGVFTLDAAGTSAVCTAIIDATAGIYELKLL